MLATIWVKNNVPVVLKLFPFATRLYIVQIQEIKLDDVCPSARKKVKEIAYVVRLNEHLLEMEIVVSTTLKLLVE